MKWTLINPAGTNDPDTGDIYSGLWYPVTIAALTLLIGMLLVTETKDVDIRADRGAA